MLEGIPIPVPVGFRDSEGKGGAAELAVGFLFLDNDGEDSLSSTVMPPLFGTT